MLNIFGAPGASTYKPPSVTDIDDSINIVSTPFMFQVGASTGNMCFKSATSFVVFLLPLVFSSNQPEVTIEQGTVRGLYKKTRIGNREYVSFEGMPYAEPPGGKHRFKEPIPAKPWMGIYNATKEPPKCLQFDMLKMLNNSEQIIGSEDCLYVNVYTPRLPTGAEKEKPFDVIAFIHGGGFMMLYSTFHDASLLLDRDIILVTFNYRLGPLGFLSAGDDVLPGNYGMKDQVLALKWIQQNIAAFGGNPGSITLAGMSAGGASCQYHLLSPLSKGLFKGAICMSGVSFNKWAISSNPKEKATVIANELGCPTNDTKTMVKCLRKRPAEHIVYLINKFKHGEMLTIPFAPVIEQERPNAFISAQPKDILSQKSAMDVPLLLTFVADEGLVAGAAILNNPMHFSNIIKNWDEIMPIMMGLDLSNYASIPESKKLQFTQKIKEHYKIDNSTQGAKNLIKELGDSMFVMDIGVAAKLHAAHCSSPVYLSKFSYRGEHSATELFTKENLGVSHGDDTIYLFGNPLMEKFTTKSDIQMSQQMVDLWVKFAATGSLGENWQPVKQHLPQLTYTDIRGPNDLKLIIAEEIGEEKFWKSLIATSFSRDEL